MIDNAETASRSWSYHVIDPNDLTAIDLMEERDNASAGQYDQTEALIDAIRIHIGGVNNVAEALIINGRIGICTVGDSDWGDVGVGTDAIEAAIDDYLNDADAWEART